MSSYDKKHQHRVQAGQRHDELERQAVKQGYRSLDAWRQAQVAKDRGLSEAPYRIRKST